MRSLRLSSRAPFAATAIAFAVAFSASIDVAAAFDLLTAGKRAYLENRGDPSRNGGSFTVGRDDRALEILHPPACPSTSRVEVEAYLQSSQRDAVLASVTLDCAKWSPRGRTWRYEDAGGTVRSIRYGKNGLEIEVRGPGFTPITGPVAFLQVQLTIGTDVLRARFHDFERNDGAVVRARKPVRDAAVGEAGFWDVMLADDRSEAHQLDTIAHLERAARRERHAGRSRFLLAMLYMYRFGQQVTRFDDVSDAAKADLRFANAWFAEALPLLWNATTLTGDSRVPGFAAAAEYSLGVVESDPALTAQGLADLEQAFTINPFFNVFDYIPVLQASLPSDPVFQMVFGKVAAYVESPETLSCVASQPEICNNAGMAPWNIPSTLVLFGDIYAKAGDLQHATNWYNLANALRSPAYPFGSVIDDRLANASDRVARYQDADPSNDPALIGAGAEACAVCHARH